MMSTIFYFVFGFLAILVITGIVIIMRNASKISSAINAMKKRKKDDQVELSSVNVIPEIIIPVSIKNRFN